MDPIKVEALRLAVGGSSITAPTESEIVKRAEAFETYLRSAKRRSDAEQMDAEMADELGGMVREAAKRVTGGNCAFAMDDLAILEHLAMKAADILMGLHPSVAAKVQAASIARRDSGRLPKGRDGTARCEASHSGAEGNRPKPSIGEPQ